MWINYALAMELNKKTEKVKVATLLMVIDKEAQKVLATFTGWENEDNNTKNINKASGGGSADAILSVQVAL